MADLLSQNDLNALFGLPDEGGATTDVAPAEPATGLSQGDLDSLLAGLADLTPSPKLKSPIPPIQEESAAAAGDTLSQDEIDKLLADFGK